MVENGRIRYDQFSAEKNTLTWINLINGPIATGYDRWIKSALRRKTFFLLRVLANSTIGIDPHQSEQQTSYTIIKKMAEKKRKIGLFKLLVFLIGWTLEKLGVKIKEFVDKPSDNDIS